MTDLSPNGVASMQSQRKTGFYAFRRTQERFSMFYFILFFASSIGLNLNNNDVYFTVTHLIHSFIYDLVL